MKVVIVDTIHGVLERMLTGAGFECLDLARAGDAEVFDALGHAEGLVMRSRFAVDRDCIDRCPRLKFIARAGAGMEHIDVEYAGSRGIRVFSSPEGNRQAVAEHALAMLLALFNRLPATDREVRQGIWLRKENEGEELAGKTVGIIGYGNTGAAFARVLSGFGVRVLAYDKYVQGFGAGQVEEVSMDAVFREADVVSLHLPMTAETHMLVNASWIARFRKPFYLINTSRGRIARTADLLDALDAGRLRGACLDVLEFETENLDLPAMEALPPEAGRLARHPGVILSPHIAGLTVQSYEKLSRILAEKIVAAFSGSA